MRFVPSQIRDKKKTVNLLEDDQSSMEDESVLSSLKETACRFGTEGVPKGTRWCGACGAVLSSSKRMLTHLRGSRHLEHVKRRYLESPTESMEEAWSKYSIAPMSRLAPDPIDAALDEIEEEMLCLG